MSSRHGFTLVEMLVALAVTSLLTVLMLRMFTDSSTIWKQQEDRLDTFREARAALQLMARELASVNPAPELAADFPVLALQHHWETEEADKANGEVYALASVPNGGRGDWCAIGYFCGWDAKKSAYVLRRQFADSDDTFANLRTALAAGSPQAGSMAFRTLFARPGGSHTATEEATQDVASYIWDLQFAVPPLNPTATPAPYPQGASARALPEWVEIRFRALGLTAARKLEGQGLTRQMWFAKNNPTYQRLILPGEQQFISRVKLSR